MKIKIPVEVVLRKSKEFPACWEYTFEGKTYIVISYDLVNTYPPYDMTYSEQSEYKRLKFNPVYSKDYKP